MLWGAVQRMVMHFGPSKNRAGFAGQGPPLAEALFDAVLESPSGLVFSRDEPADSHRRVRTPGGKFRLVIAELVPELEALAAEGEPPRDPPPAAQAPSAATSAASASVMSRLPSMWTRFPSRSMTALRGNTCAGTR